jgi:hypothetical protein
MTAVLHRLDHMSVGIARLSGPPGSGAPLQQYDVPGLPSRAVIEAKLRERGIPISTVRQVNVVLEELRIIR